MKNFKFFFINFILLSGIYLSQTPQGFSYQAVVRNASNNVVANSNVGVHIEIRKYAADGSVAYSETHTATTNINGLFTITIGNGTPGIGSFSSIDWGGGAYYIHTDIDPNGGTNYSISNTSQLLSVPYALYAKNVENVPQPIFISDDSTLFLSSFRNVVIEIPDISITVPQNGKYLIFLEGSITELQYNSKTNYDSFSNLRLYDSANNPLMVDISSTNIELDNYDMNPITGATEYFYSYKAEETIKSKIITLTAGQVLKVKYFVTAVGFPSGQYKVNPIKLSILKVAN